MSRESCTCNLCVSCCHRTPGWFKPGEAEKAAALLGMPFEEFKKEYLIQEYWVGDAEHGNIYILSPRKTWQPKGFERAAYSDAFTVGTCIFLENDLCKIHAEKPFECKQALGCDTKPYKNTCREKISNIWKRHQKKAEAKCNKTE